MLSYLTLIPYCAMIGIHTQLLLIKFYLQTLVSNVMVLKICYVWYALSLCGIECRMAFLGR